MLMTKNRKEEISYRLFDEYVYLSNLSCLNTREEDRLAVILNEAISNPSLDELINDFEIAMLILEDKKELLDEQAKLSEHFIGRSSKSNKKSLNCY